MNRDRFFNGEAFFYKGICYRYNVDKKWIESISLGYTADVKETNHSEIHWFVVIFSTNMYEGKILFSDLEFE